MFEDAACQVERPDDSYVRKCLVLITADACLVLEIIRGFYAQAEKLGGGLTVYLNLRSYPAVLIFTAYGLGLTSARRREALHALFDAVIDRQHREPVRAIDSLFLWAWKGTESDVWKQIEDLQNHKTRLSGHLLIVFSEWAKRCVGLTPDSKLLFVRFEVLGSLAHFEKNDKAELSQSLSQRGNNNFAWMPLGASWHSQNGEKLTAEIETAAMKAALVKAGFAKRDLEMIDLFVANFKLMSSRMRW